MRKICDMRTLLKYAKNAAKCQICGNRIFAFSWHAYLISTAADIDWNKPIVSFFHTHSLHPVWPCIAVYKETISRSWVSTVSALSAMPTHSTWRSVDLCRTSLLAETRNTWSRFGAKWKGDLKSENASVYRINQLACG